jgi:hypothetical protein
MKQWLTANSVLELEDPEDCYGTGITSPTSRLDLQPDPRSAGYAPRRCLGTNSAPHLGQRRCVPSIGKPERARRRGMELRRRGSRTLSHFLSSDKGVTREAIRIGPCGILNSLRWLSRSEHTRFSQCLVDWKCNSAQLTRTALALRTPAKGVCLTVGKC